MAAVAEAIAAGRSVSTSDAPPSFRLWVMMVDCPAAVGAFDVLAETQELFGELEAYNVAKAHHASKAV